MSLDAFQEQYVKLTEHALTAKADGPVQITVQDALLADLEAQTRALDAALEPGQVLYIESQRGVDEPRAREDRKDVIVEGENRLYFHWWVDPPARFGVYAKRS